MGYSPRGLKESDMTEQVTRRGLENSVLKSEDVIFRGEMRQDGKWSEIRQWKTSNDSLRGLVFH